MLLLGAVAWGVLYGQLFLSGVLVLMAVPLCLPETMTRFIRPLYWVDDTQPDLEMTEIQAAIDPNGAEDTEYSPDMKDVKLDPIPDSLE